MKLNRVLERVKTVRIEGEQQIEIGKLEFDSRKITSGDVFIALKGTLVDGHRYIQKAIELGAIAIVCEDWPETSKDVTLVQVADSRAALGWMAATYFGYPSRELKLVGVTGTNGKTTTVTLLYQLFTQLGYKSGLLSTIENRVGGSIVPSTHTTPDPVSIQRLLAEMVDAGCPVAFMEVSSHAADQKRIAGLEFSGAVFTNITHDHLDYHKTFKNYINAKKKFFDILPKEAFALVNRDDRRNGVMVQNTAAKVYSYSVRSMADYKAKVLESELTGMLLEINGTELYSKMVGGFNAYNLLCVFAVADLLGEDRQEILTSLSILEGAAGRFETIQAPSGAMGIVDYAHTPDALEKVLDTIDKVLQGRGKIRTVVGCGGDRDRAKRPLMAKIACDYSSTVLLTSDNPRSEDPAVIVAEMQAGVPPEARAQVLQILDRREAIRTAVMLAGPNDVVLVAGKGHENYQEIHGKRIPFDDLSVLKEAMQIAD
ncbi:MAG: UDP-N-acetylmuramoyl-L-alanyl-D-glutamate--2,6-diaminopimelate ligase [Bacteroidota bacterium]